MNKLILVMGLLFLATTKLASAGTTLGPNLITNPGFEASSTPTGWLKGGYGTNTRILPFPVPGYQSSQADRVTISAYTSGDAKWYFNYVPVTAGHTYQFSDNYESTAQTSVYVQFKLGDGTFSYLDIANLPAASSYQGMSAQFVAPTNAVSLTVFHLIRSVGTLDTDNYSLNEVTQTANNLIPNGNLETGTASQPANWSSGKWGSNDATFSYPSVSPDGSKAVSLQINNYSSGDAKWYFNPLNLPGGIYTFSDEIISNATSYLTVQYQNGDGSFTYRDIATIPASASATTTTAKFYVPAGTVNVTVFHLLNSVGFLTLDNATLQKTGDAEGIFATGAVTLTFDDGWLSQYQNAFPKLQSSDVPASFYIISHQLSDFGFPGYMSEADVQNLYNAGEEIGAHTRTHPHLSQLSASDQQGEIIGSQTDLNNLGVGPVTTFAYPFGDYNDTTLSILRSSTIEAARSSIGGYADPLSDPYQLPRQVVVVTSSFQDLANWINVATSSKTWLIIELHEVNTSGDQYSITPDLFDELVDYLVAQKVKVVTLAQGLVDLSK